MGTLLILQDMASVTGHLTNTLRRTVNQQKRRVVTSDESGLRRFQMDFRDDTLERLKVSIVVDHRLPRGVLRFRRVDWILRSCRDCSRSGRGHAARTKEVDAVFVWLFHRVSGILLVVLLPLQLITGVFQIGSGTVQVSRTMAAVHGHAFLNSLLAFLVIFHGLYGVRTILLDCGVGREKLLFWVCTVLGIILFAAFLLLSLMVATA